MSRSDIERLRDAREHAGSALKRLEQLSFDEVFGSADRFDAFWLDLVFIGTTLSKVSKAVQALNPRLPWRKIADTRNRLVHAYWQVDSTLLRVIEPRQLIDLMGQLDQVIALLEEDPD